MESLRASPFSLLQQLFFIFGTVPELHPCCHRFSSILPHSQSLILYSLLKNQYLKISKPTFFFASLVCLTHHTPCPHHYLLHFIFSPFHHYLEVPLIDRKRGKLPSKLDILTTCKFSMHSLKIPLCSKYSLLVTNRKPQKWAHHQEGVKLNGKGTFNLTGTWKTSKLEMQAPEILRGGGMLPEGNLDQLHDKKSPKCSIWIMLIVGILWCWDDLVSML